MDTVGAVIIRYRWAKVFLGWSQYRERRVPPMEPTVTCPWPRRSFKSEVIGFGLTWRGMGSARSTWLRHGTHELISLCFSHQICRGTGQMFSHAESLRPHPIMRLLMMMMNIKIASEKIQKMVPLNFPRRLPGMTHAWRSYEDATTEALR